MKKKLLKGNEALGIAAIQAGCKHFFGYPITPQTELAAYMAKELPKVDGVFLQAESEIAAINMVLGAASTGVRAMTSSSSPGISLKTEGISYIAASDLPCLIVNVQRGGPGLGGIQPSQSDYWQATRALGHGDFHVLVYTPSTVQEIVDSVFEAFDTSEEYRIPAMILMDGMLGQMMETVVLPEINELIPKTKDWASCGHKNLRKHNIINSLYLDPAVLEQTIIDRFKRYDYIKDNLQKSESYMVDDAEIVLVAYGSASRVSKSAVNAARDLGIKAGLLKPLTVWPFPNLAIERLCQTTNRFLCVEMSMGQMIDDVRLVVNGRKPVAFFGRTGGIIPTPAEILAEIKKEVGYNEI
jgi:2-oxoglutarate ferredoxin oxidoreductase subunit alpha